MSQVICCPNLSVTELESAFQGCRFALAIKNTQWWATSPEECGMECLPSYISKSITCPRRPQAGVL